MGRFSASHDSPHSSTSCANTENPPYVGKIQKKRIGVSKKFCTSVHPYAPRPPDGCVSVCRSGHWPSAVKTKKIQHADANSQTQPGTNLHRRAAIVGDYTADGQWPPLHTGMCPALLVCSYRCTDVQNFFRNSYTFFLRLSTISQSSKIHCKTPIQNEKTQIFRAAGNPKGLRPFWSF